MREPSGEKNITRRKDLRFNYEVVESVEAGLVLRGTEVKSLREGAVSLVDSYCKFKVNELFVLSMQITPYSHGTYANHPPDRPRKLLLHKRELVRLKAKVQEKGLTLVPARLYFKDGKAKMEVALVKGKKLYDKRDAAKKKEQRREMERVVKRSR
jgi:SsrA-binding protein